MEKHVAIFAAGCFWGVEATYRQVPGVLQTEVGYTGGSTKNPTYKNVGTGKTGHVEALKITFDPTVVSYEFLVDLFFKSHDSTTLNRQGPDVGTQYRSAIFYLSEEQKTTAEQIKSNYQESLNHKDRRIVTEIRPAGTFYPAEEYHQQYFEKFGFHPCVNFFPLPKKTGTLSKLQS
ncbi:MAG: peptide methionine sulfoxide reductase [Promethearchaeota archaeon CR_4]|nr:MAG: peptide methionine sulfoxide reductase [Candidatus Lokiarchaeota archaeon CR_4]